MSSFRKLRWAPCRTWICATLLLTSTAVFARQRLSASEMRSVISGNTLSGKTEWGADFHVYHSPDRKMSAQGKLAYYDVGIWEITDDGKYCREWTYWRDAARDCFEMYRIGEDRFRIKAINYHYESIFRMRKGDPQNLKGRI